MDIKHSPIVLKQYQSAVHGDLICRRPRTLGFEIGHSVLSSGEMEGLDGVDLVEQHEMR